MMVKKCLDIQIWLFQAYCTNFILIFYIISAFHNIPVT